MKLRTFFTIALSILLLLNSAPFVSAQNQRPYSFGTLQSDGQYAAVNKQRGINMAVVSLSWSEYEKTGEGQFNQAYIDSKRLQIKQHRDAGQEVVLSIGVHYTPTWVLSTPNSRYVNQFGEPYIDTASGKNIANLVFNQQLREKMQAYLTQVFADLGYDSTGKPNFAAIRLGGGWYGELNYPDNAYRKLELTKTGVPFGRNQYWAYDAFAQGNGVGLATGISPLAVRLKGWKPGTISTNHQDARDFINWYLNSLKNYHDWQITMVDKLYPHGKLFMMYPSWGVRPARTGEVSQLEEAIAVDLNGSSTTEINGELQRGFDFERFAMGITNPRVSLYTTWLDAEFGSDISTNPKNWTPGKYLRNLSDRHPLKLEVWGENTGTATTPTEDYADMVLMFNKMLENDLQGVFWAFEPKLFDAQNRYATQAQYGDCIAKAVFGYSCTYTSSPLPTPIWSSPSPSIPAVDSACKVADINSDNTVDLTDYSLLVSDFFKVNPSNPRSDINSDGKVDISDYSLLVKQFGKNC